MYKIICKVSRKILPKIIASSTEQVAILITKEYKKNVHLFLYLLIKLILIHDAQIWSNEKLYRITQKCIALYWNNNYTNLSLNPSRVPNSVFVTYTGLPCYAWHVNSIDFDQTVWSASGTILLVAAHFFFFIRALLREDVSDGTWKLCMTNGRHVQSMQVSLSPKHPYIRFFLWTHYQLRINQRGQRG